MKDRTVSGQGPLLTVRAAISLCTAALLFCGHGQTQTPSSPQAKSAPPATATRAAGPQGAPTRFQPPLIPRRAALFYESVWGVDDMRVRTAESGELIRFSWRVVDPERSRTLNDKKLDPALIAPAAHVKLVIPSLEKVGQLRQSSTPEAGKSYWMAFSNPGRKVKSGDRVDIAIGPFHAEGLVVE